jgi:hypothetical protein
VVRAGLLPALAGGVLLGSQNCAQALMRPGEHPFDQLRRATRKLEREWRGVLVVDQFEELFTSCQDEAERTAFATALVRWALDQDGGATVIAVRADFYGRCAVYPDLSALLGANHVLVGPMARDELRRAIERPARAPAWRSSRISPRPCWPTSKAGRERCRCSPPRCWSYGANATDGACAWPPTPAAAGCRARSRGWPRPPTSRWTRSSRRRPGRCCCG